MSEPALTKPKPRSAPQPTPPQSSGGGTGIKKLFKRVWSLLWEDPEEAEQPRVSRPPAPPAPPAFEPVRQTQQTQQGQSGPSKITLSLQPIVEGLPEPLKALARCKGSETVTLDGQPILDQLASGAVKISFGELRRRAPSGSLSNNPQYDQELVEIPLQEVVAKVGQYLPARRPKKRLEVPENVAGPFVMTKTGSAPAAPAVPEARPAEKRPVPAAQPPQTRQPATAAPVPAPRPQAAPLPAAAPIPLKMPAAPKETPAIPVKVAPAPALKEASPIPLKLASAPKETPAIPLKPAASPAPAAAKPQSVPAPAAPAKGAMTETGLLIGIADICEGWPAPVLQELEAGRLKSSALVLPMDRLEPALRAGRIAFSWGELSQWIQPSGWIGEAANEPIEVELPLQIIAPLFMSQKRSGQARKKVALDQSIPDVFGPATQQKPAQAPAKAPVASAPVQQPQPAKIPLAPAAKPAPPAPVVDPDVALLNELLGLLAKSDWSPKDLVLKAASLKGVAGLIIGTPDGFLVASQMPPHFQGEMLAGLFPQLFSKLNEYFSDLELGQMNHLRFTVGNSTFGVYKGGELFLAALARSGEKLPEASLEKIAAALAQRPA